MSKIDTPKAINQRKRWNEDEEYRKKRLESARAWRARNKEILREKRLKFLEDNKERLILERKNKRYLVNKRLKERRETDINYKLTELFRFRLRREIKKCGTTKVGKYSELLGCTIEEMRTYLESLFLEGMSWDNHGVWHIDHIKPCCSFDLVDPEQQKICFHYKNLQPLWAIDNIKKGGKV